MNDYESPKLNQFFEEGFAFETAKKLTARFSKQKNRSFHVRPKPAPIWKKIGGAIEKYGFEDIEPGEVESLSREDLWHASIIVGIAAAPFHFLSLFYAYYYFHRIDKDRLLNLVVMIRMLNDTKAITYQFANIGKILDQALSEELKQATANW
jgi:hypothetical protein